MDEITIQANGSEGTCLVSPRVATWDLAHDAVAGISITTDYVSASTSHDAFGGVGRVYTCGRGFLYFDTSPLAGKVILTAKIRVFIANKAESDDGDADLHIVEGVQDDPLVEAAYGDHLLKATSLGSIAYDDIVDDAWNEITLNAAGIALLDLEGISKFCVKVSGDIDDHTPTGPSTGNRFTFRSSHTPDLEPEIIITYIEEVNEHYHLNIKNLNLPYEDKNGSKELHVLLKNLSPTAKEAGGDGELVVEVKYEPAA